MVGPLAGHEESISILVTKTQFCVNGLLSAVAEPTTLKQLLSNVAKFFVASVFRNPNNMFALEITPVKQRLSENSIVETTNRLEHRIGKAV